MKDGDRSDDNLPTSGDAMQIPFQLMGQVAGINDEQLSERHVRPKQHEGQQQISQMMIMDFVHSTCDWIPISEEREHYHRERVCCENLPDEQNDPEHS